MSFITKLLFGTAASDSDQQDNLPQQMRRIGQGQCGTVWTLPGTDQVIKIMNIKKMDQLWNDCCMHAAVEEAFATLPKELSRGLHIPKLVTWVQPCHIRFWEDCKALSSTAQLQPTYGLVSERIHPIPTLAREALVNAFAPAAVKRNKNMFLALEENNDCLIRLYLGRRHRRSPDSHFKLRNFDLMVNEMEERKFDTKLFATIIAGALAVLHWKARIDAQDVEFVLGSSPLAVNRPTAARLKASDPTTDVFCTEALDPEHRTLGIWLLDFNECNIFTEDEKGIQQLQKAFYFNDPYYPRPSSNSKDQVLWETFREAYLSASAKIESSMMPTMFIEAVEAEGQRRSRGSSLFS